MRSCTSPTGLNGDALQLLPTLLLLLLLLLLLHHILLP
jgi:hypothetical protein